MPTRRDAVLLISALPIGLMTRSSNSATAPSPLGSAAVDSAVTPDRELTLFLSDQLNAQRWRYAGQNYLERREHIVVNEHETVRLIFRNDTDQSRILYLDSVPLHLEAGDSFSVDMRFDELQSKSILDKQSGKSKIIVVRPSYQGHAIVA